MAPVEVVDNDSAPEKNRIILNIKCVKCSRNVRNGILCDSCDRWNHFACANITDSDLPEETSEWKCPKCSEAYPDTIDNNVKLNTGSDEDKGSLLVIIAELQEDLKALRDENQKLKLTIEESDCQVCLNISDANEILPESEVRSKTNFANRPSRRWETVKSKGGSYKSNNRKFSQDFVLPVQNKYDGLEIEPNCLTDNSVQEPIVGLRKRSKQAKKRKIKIYSDSYARGLSAVLRDSRPSVSKECEIEGTVKPGAGFRDVAASIRKDCETFTDKDFVVVMAGANDVSKNERKTATSALKKTLEVLTHTNVIVVNVPHRHDLPQWSCVNKEVDCTNQDYKAICPRSAMDLSTEPGLIGRLAVAVGASEAALKILLSILLAHPISLFHRYNLYGKNQDLQHIYFIVCGLAIGIFNFGWDIFHTLATVIVVYTILKFAGGSLISTILIFGFTMGYLLIGYYMTSTETYDIKWTMPQCVLTLRLTGLAFDIYDGSKPLESLSSENKKVALKRIPSLLEILAFSYFPASFLVGPQFSMKRYQDFVSGEFRGSETGLPDCLKAAVSRSLTGVLYLTMYQVGYIYFPDNYLVSEHFQSLGILKRLLYMGIWGHVALYKYICIWLLCEGVCIEIGLTYNGKDESGKPKWDGCANVNLSKFEGATIFTHYIESFNINTNHWVAQYIYKRLKFLGNKHLSQLGVLLFLAVWHGFHSGYYMCFFLEFVCLVMERDLQAMLTRNKAVLEFLSKPGVSHLTLLLLKLYTLVFMGYCMAPFVLLSVQKWFTAFYHTFFIGHVVWMGWHAYRPLVKILLPPAKESTS